MSVRASYSQARARLAEIWDEVENSREPAILERRGHDAMALLPADELESLKETAYLLRSPGNAARCCRPCIVPARAGPPRPTWSPSPGSSVSPTRQTEFVARRRATSRDPRRARRTTIQDDY